MKHLDKPKLIEAKSQEQFVHGIFSSIAAHYDWLNSLLSFNFDVYWRHYAIKQTKVPAGGRALDLCCGTGKLTLGLAKEVNPGGSVTGVDFCGDMLEIARKNIAKTEYAGQIALVEANVLALPFDDNFFDCCTIGFGLRNVADIPGALAEFYRVLKPGGRLVILELGKPTLPGFKSLYWFYFQKVLPLLGQTFAKVKGAYQWLPESLSRFPEREKLVELLNSSGFQDVGCQSLTCGITDVYFGEK